MIAKGYWNITVVRANGQVEVIADQVPNLLTNGGRDFLHNQGYTNTSAGTRGSNYIGLSSDATAPDYPDTVLASEIAVGGLQRAEATTNTHSNGTNTSTIGKTFTATQTHTNVQKAALFNASSSGTMTHETAFTPVTLNNNDTLTATYTLTLG